MKGISCITEGATVTTHVESIRNHIRTGLEVSVLLRSQRLQVFVDSRYGSSSMHAYTQVLFCQTRIELHAVVLAIHIVFGAIPHLL